MRMYLLAGIVSMFVAVIVIGCGTLYKTLGLPPEQVEVQVAKDAVIVEAVVEQTRNTFWPILSAAIGCAGTLVSALLAKLLVTERKMTGAMIAGVEKAGNGDAKKAVTVESLRRGVGVQLAKRVRKLV